LEDLMRRKIIYAGLLVCVGAMVGATATIDVAADESREGGRHEVVLRDDCDPRDPAWAPTGGCSLPEGDVTFAEFNALRLSPLAPSLVGHPAWWFDPNYMKIEEGKRIKVTNEGGRVHTFTEVANFGGGRVPPLNTSRPADPPIPSLTPAPECVAAGVVDIPGGGKDVVDGLAAGNHNFQCCIHPWMRTRIHVEAAHNH
jgi:plastocyanin